MDVRNPLDGIDRDDRFRETPRQRVLTGDELRRLWRACDSIDGLGLSIGPATAIAIQLALATLQRAGEIAGLNERELDLERAVWTIPAARAKNGRDHHVPLSPLALRLIARAQLIRGAREAAAPIFPSPRRDADGAETPIARHALSHAFARIAAHLGVVDAVLHDCRRTGATLLASMESVQMIDISRLLNHVSDRDGGSRITLGTYALRADHMPRKRRAAELWTDELMGIVYPPETNLLNLPRARA
jgi:integrase